MNTVLLSNNGLYDPVQKRIITIPYVQKIYGHDVFKQLGEETNKARELRRASPEEAFSEDLINTMKEICIKKFPTSGFEVERPFDERAIDAFRSSIGFYIEPVSNEVAERPKSTETDNNIQRQRQKCDDFFLMLERGLFLNPEFRKIFKGPITVYGWIWSNIVRKGWVDKKGYPIKKRYYDRGLLAYCSSYSKIARECFMDKDTVKKYVDLFKSKGIIKVDFITPEGRKFPQGVYILGEWMELDGKPIERFFLNQVLLSAKEDDIWGF